MQWLLNPPDADGLDISGVVIDYAEVQAVTDRVAAILAANPDLVITVQQAIETGGSDDPQVVARLNILGDKIPQLAPAEEE